jgi:hypothetical protein
LLLYAQEGLLLGLLSRAADEHQRKEIIAKLHSMVLEESQWGNVPSTNICLAGNGGRGFLADELPPRWDLAKGPSLLMPSR